MKPTQSDLHVNRPLTNISVLTVQDEKEFVAGKVLKNIPVEKQSDKYFVYNDGDFNRNTMALRSDGAPVADDGWALSTDEFYCDVFALGHPVTDLRRANTDEPLDEDADAAKFLTHKALLKREADFVSTFFTTGVWTGGADTVSCGLSGNDVTVNTAWDNASGVPIKCIKEQIAANKALTGFRANTLVLPEEVWNALQESADFLARITGGSTSQNPAVLMPQMLASILSIDNVYIAGAIQNTAKEGQTATNAFFFADAALLCYVPPSPGIRTPACGYTYSWKRYGTGAYGGRIKKYRDERIAGDRIEIEDAYDMKVVNAKMGVFFTNVMT
ncbi:MAG: hypothetical protein IT381_14850 [Deltaproteobacteria bacterium]|nr:hypothetical protein [Deltaproteobacteria bacterium]